VQEYVHILLPTVSNVNRGIWNNSILLRVHEEITRVKLREMGSNHPHLGSEPSVLPLNYPGKNLYSIPQRVTDGT
jgi:hypothetical protein